MKERYSKIYNNLYSFEERKQLVAKMIKEVRISKGLTQKEVCDIIDVALPTYNSYETGRSATPIEVVVRLSHLYDIDPAILLQFDNFEKDKMIQENKLSEFEKQIAELKEKVKKANPDEQERINQYILGMEQMLNALK